MQEELLEETGPFLNTTCNLCGVIDSLWRSFEFCEVSSKNSQGETKG